MTKEDIKKLLRTRNLKATELRLDLLKIISSFSKAVSYKEIQNSLIKFDRVTLYRTLNTFINRGILHKIIFEDNQSFYALCSMECTSDKHQCQHIHFQCNHCKEVSCIESKNSIQLDISNHFVDDIEITASGLCQRCHN